MKYLISNQALIAYCIAVIILLAIYCYRLRSHLAAKDDRVHRWLFAHQQIEKWMAEFPEVVMAVGQMRDIAEDNQVTGINVMREIMRKHRDKTTIILTPAEIQSGSSRVRWAEGLIRQLPENHDGRNSWLLNYARKDKA